MNMHLHIDAGILIDGTNELLPESEKDYSETQANLIDLLTEFAEDPNQCSEEPKATFEQCPRRQAPVHDPIILRIIFILLFCICCNIFIVQLCFLGVDRKP